MITKATSKSIDFCIRIFYIVLQKMLPVGEVWNSRVTKSSYEIDLNRMTSNFESLTQKCSYEFFFLVTDSSS